MIRLTITQGSLEALKTNNEGGIPLEEFPLGFNTGGMIALSFSRLLYSLRFQLLHRYIWDLIN